MCLGHLYTYLRAVPTQGKETPETEETCAKVSLGVRPFERTANPKPALSSQPASPLSAQNCRRCGRVPPERMPASFSRSPREVRAPDSVRTCLTESEDTSRARVSDPHGPRREGGVRRYPVCSSEEISSLAAGFWLLDVTVISMLPKSRVCPSKYREYSQ